MSSPSTSISEEEIMKSSETAQALYHNHLIMSEVYRYLDRSDLSQCLLVTKTGYHTAAKAFFHTSSHESFTKMTAKGCSFDRLADLARMVRVLTLPWLAIIHRTPGQYQIHHGEILSQFPSLDVVQLCGLGSGRLHTVEEKHEIDGRELLVQFPAYYLTCLFSIPPSKSLFLVPGSTKWSSRALSFSPQSRAHCQDELVKQARMASLSAAQPFRFRNVDKLVFKWAISYQDLNTILCLCPKLQTLSVRIAKSSDPGSPQSKTQFYDWINRESGTLRDISLHNPNLDCLPRLQAVKRVFFSCKALLNEQWMREDNFVDCRPQSASSIESLVLRLSVPRDKPPPSPLLVAKLIHHCITRRTIVQVDGKHGNTEADSQWLEMVRSTLRWLRDEEELARAVPCGYFEVRSPQDAESEELDAAAGSVVDSCRVKREESCIVKREEAD